MCCLLIALFGRRELNGSYSCRTYLTIGNLGNFQIMGGKSGLAMLFGSYWVKYRLWFGSIIGQERPVTRADSKDECIIPPLLRGELGGCSVIWTNLSPKCAAGSYYRMYDIIACMILSHYRIYWTNLSGSTFFRAYFRAARRGGSYGGRERKRETFLIWFLLRNYWGRVYWHEINRK